MAAVAEPSSDDIRAETGAETTAAPVVPPHIGRDLALYVLARFALVAVVAVILTLINVPLLISVAVGLIAGVPLSMVVLRGRHEKVATGLAARGVARRAARDALRAELRGDTRSGTASPDAG